MSVSVQEQESILSLIKYFQPIWRIVDCGSNKGNWFETLINYRDGSTEAGKYEIHSIEPNDKLRSYQEVKYDYNDKIAYYPCAISNFGDKEVDFWYWENKNNGLSSLFLNKQWEEEVGEFRNHKKVKTSTLDELFYFDAPENYLIDIIKIDVEGAESLVLEGALELLRNKRVKFFQVEYSPHYKLANREFRGILNYIDQFGYSAWSWDGKCWNKIVKEEFVEDYRLENFILTYKNIAKGSRDYIDLQYTQLWNSEFKKNTEFLKGKINLALELGSFEGLTSNYICDELLTKDSGGRLICVDPLIDGVYLEGHKDNHIFIDQYSKFINNTRDQPIELQRKTSQQAFEGLGNYRFDLIYVDGDHTFEGVYYDAVNYFSLLRREGVMIFDDYGQAEETKGGIDKFLNQFADRLQILIKEYQVVIKKIGK